MDYKSETPNSSLNYPKLRLRRRIGLPQCYQLYFSFQIIELIKFTSISATDSDMSTTIDESDQQKRERIEKYKEQRRSKLRAQYKPENYRSSSQSSLESQSAEESSIQTSRKQKVCIIFAGPF